MPNDRVNVAPWPDYAGAPIHEGDTIVHPVSGERGKVVYLADEADEGAQWRVDYGTGHLSRLCLQIGDKGRAVVEPRCTCPSGGGSLAWPCPSHAAPAQSPAAPAAKPIHLWRCRIEGRRGTPKIWMEITEPAMHRIRANDPAGLHIFATAHELNK